MTNLRGADAVIAWVGLLSSTALLALAVCAEPDARGHGSHESLGLEPCAYLIRTGRPCATCGMTTAFANAARFRVVDAFRASPAGLFLFFLTVAALLWFVRALRLGIAPLAPFGRGRWLIYLVVVIAAVLSSWHYKLSRWD